MKLSICIPTFGREKWLIESLTMLLPEADESGVEVCVSDNATASPTKKLALEQLARRHPSLKVQVNSINVGLESNMKSVVRMASGEFVYQLGDDDRLIGGAISRVLQILNHSTLQLLILQGWHTDADLNNQRLHLTSKLEGKQFGAAVEAFQDTWHLMPYGSFICRRAALDEAYWRPYEGTSHAYAGAVWSYLAKTAICQGAVQCAREPFVKLRNGDKTWTSRSIFIHLVEIPNWLKLLPSVYEVDAAQILVSHMTLHTTFGRLVDLRLNSTPYDNLTELTQHFSTKQRRKFNTLRFFPRIILQFARRIVRPMLRSVKQRRGQLVGKQVVGNKQAH